MLFGNPHKGRNRLGGGHKQTVVQRKAYPFAAIKDKKNIPLGGKGQVSVARAEPGPGGKALGFGYILAKGVAKALLNALEIEAKKFETEVINLEVRKSNLPAINLYKQMGYEESGERPNFYTKPTENAILMAKKVK